MKQFTLVLTLATFCLPLSGCSPDKLEGDLDVQGRVGVPAFEPSLIEAESFGTTVGIRAEGLEEYIAKFGKPGWIQGLSDSRPAFADARGESREREERSLRIKDVFYFYYCKSFPMEGRQPVKAWATWKERDALVQEILREVRGQPDR